MEQPKFKWCRETIAQVRFKPDRDKIWDELMAHIEDRSEALKEFGLTEEEAQAKAVAAMGDPVAVGKQLDKVHKPWLGWLWIVSKVLVILCLIVFAWNGLVVERFGYTSYGYRVALSDWEAGILREDGTELPAEVTQLYYDEPGVSARIGDFTLTVEKVTLNRAEELMLYDFALVLITVDGFLPWESAVETQNFYMVDDQGNCYTPRYRPDAWDIMTQRNKWEMSMGRCGRTGTTWSYLLHFYPEDMEWFELRYDLDGRSIALRVDMAGGEGS